MVLHTPSSWLCDRMTDSTTISRWQRLAAWIVEFETWFKLRDWQQFQPMTEKISWWEILINYRLIWCRLTWQLSHLSFTCTIKMTFFAVPQKLNQAIILINFSAINYIYDQHRYPKFTLLDVSFRVALISKQITDPYIGSGFHVIYGMSTEPRHVISMRHRQSQVSCETCIRSAS